ncbi:beta-ketoacyl-[acyl-carrier-protein] synthase family protein [Arthrobacter sp. FX8]|jgi:3-oxoacyl-[acyl-carrier-protein] synthase II|uniref:beta-ketoacyl-[acyl-carrier-protein] synthase family protein n=1 Tax=Micrococcaceae TaxID=1268 RepID=UPI00035D52CE|nr:MULTISPECIES: beta-ketoacyl-[acyl-carrier-protein] synthase family protein [unclassified Arthrobacter]KRE77022.1 3-oxoacyl-ACP synthase [Arthrobacter sp. Soil761]TWD51393.1 3-oxoacyl-[acyl-carrier-protein] synthase II [Arthrobacter sp. AG367]WAJ33139.1 beta-ketoacyl-[acyl-carrier-protein] synthase family protein [Arthrobacter sp. FX8]BCW52868.1 3-oxoacyl-ACP synthase [Arthrobacter sp. StoSoilB19]BCW73951.1 3-oxoacyl-ACP synthase [Arthrobacter sp. NicSoilB11]
MTAVQPRALVTGAGTINPLGSSVKETWEALLEGRSGIGPLEQDWAGQLPVKIAGQVTADLSEHLSTREMKRMDRCGQLALIAAREAWAQAGAPEVDPERFAVVIGSAYGGLGSTIEQDRVLAESGPRKVSPHTLTRLMVNGPAAWVSIDLGARGGARTPVSACASGAEAIVQAAEMIRSGAADVVIAGGVDASVNDLVITGFSQIRALSTRSDDPKLASRPFDGGRDGFVLAEGAGVVVLESEEHARARGAAVLGAVAGGAVTSDANDIVAADPAMQRRVMQKALDSAGMRPADIGFVHAHATSTPVGDRLEGQAINAVFGADVPVTSTKGHTGHLLGGAGSLAAVVVLEALRTGKVPGTLNVEALDPEVDLNVLTEGTHQLPPGYAPAGLVNAFGFGGHSVALVLTAG